MDDIKRFLQLKPEIRFAYILGSFLTEEDFRDIDVAVYLDHRFLSGLDTLKYEMALSLELEGEIKPGETFKRLIAIDAKIVNLGNAQVSFRYSVSKGASLWPAGRPLGAAGGIKLNRCILIRGLRRLVLILQGLSFLYSSRIFYIMPISSSFSCTILDFHRVLLRTPNINHG